MSPNFKCHLILTSPEEDAATQIEESRIKCSKVKKLLGIHFDYKLKVDTHVRTICKKAHRNLKVLSRITSYMQLPKRLILVNKFLKLNLTIALSLGCFNSCSLHSKINRLHERCLRIIYDDKQSNLKEFLNKDSSVSIQYNNIHALAIDLYKVPDNVSPKIISDVFKVRDTPC